MVDGWAHRLHHLFCNQSLSNDDHGNRGTLFRSANAKSNQIYRNHREPAGFLNGKREWMQLWKHPLHNHSLFDQTLSISNSSLANTPMSSICIPSIRRILSKSTIYHSSYFEEERKVEDIETGYDELILKTGLKTTKRISFVQWELHNFPAPLKKHPNAIRQCAS